MSVEHHAEQQVLKLILASSSPRRRELLSLLGVAFSTISIKTNEEFDERLTPVEIVQELARRKVWDGMVVWQSETHESFSQVHQKDQEHALIISADTIVVCDGMVFGKPKHDEEAKQMLKQLQGNSHEVYTGIALLDSKNHLLLIDYCKTNVSMITLTDEQISRYIATGEPMDKAGAYAIQGLAAKYINRIEGCYFNVVGLPISLLALHLQKYGVEVL